MFNTSHNDPSDIYSKMTQLTFPQWNMCALVLPGINGIPLQACARTGFYFQIVDKHRISELLLTQKQTITMNCSHYIKSPAQCLPWLTSNNPPPALRGAHLTPMSLMMKPDLTGLWLTWDHINRGIGARLHIYSNLPSSLWSPVQVLGCSIEKLGCGEGSHKISGIMD